MSSEEERSEKVASERGVKEAREDIRSKDDLKIIKKSRDDVESTKRPIPENPLLTIKPEKQKHDSNSDSIKKE